MDHEDDERDDDRDDHHDNDEHDDHHDSDHDGDDHGDHEDSHEHDSSNPQATAVLAGFLFGNVDEKGQLEGDFLDEESKRHLSALPRLEGMGVMMKEITEDSDTDKKSPQDDGASSDYDAKSPSAVDYSDIKEAADDETTPEGDKSLSESVSEQKHGEEEGEEHEDKDKDRKLMPPPTWLPTPSMLAAAAAASQQSPTAGGTPSSPATEGEKPKLNTPLAGLAAMLPPEYANVDVTTIFPEFRPGQVLRFSRLFKPAHHPHIYRKRKKKKEKEDEKGEGEDGKGKEKKEDKEDKPKEDKKEDEEKKGTEEEVKKTRDEERDADDEDDYDSDDDYMSMEEMSQLLKVEMGRPAKPEELGPDDEEIMKQPLDTKAKGDGQDGSGEGDQKARVAPWRYGPAQYWFDRMGVDETGEDFDFGFRLKSDSTVKQENKEDETLDVENVPSPVKIDDEAFLLVTQKHWEDEVIWDGEESKQKVLQAHKQTAEFAGWVPSTNSRTATQFLQQHRLAQNLKGGPNFAKMLSRQDGGDGKDCDWYSIFPIENDDLVYGRWEDHVIWDANNMDFIPSPPVLELDPNDENIILEIPKDVDPTEESAEPSNKKEKEVRKSRILLGKAGIIKEDEEEKEEVSSAVQTKDPFNIANDEYYNPKLMDNALRPNIGSSLIQHSTPAVELRQPFFPTHMGPIKLRSFHRQALKRLKAGFLSERGPHPVHPLHKIIKRKQKLRDQERQAYGGGEIFFMRTPQDLSSMDGDLVLAEYSEEYPPLLNQVGMASKIKNYYKRKPGKDANPPTYDFGELAYAHTSPFLGSLRPGQSVQAMENNMFRSPIFQHKMPTTDFLVIRTKSNYHIREVNTIYTVGQECPLYEVPGHNSKRANNFVRDFLQVFIYRLFWKSKDRPRRIKMEDIKKAFPSHSESSIRKRLKLCADFKRTGMDSNWWVVKPDFRLPNEEEIRAMVSPEQCCAWYSMVTAEQRLKDAGYGEKSLFAPEDDNEEDTQNKIEDEVKTAPWNTTRAYISAMKGKCLLQLHGNADPSGCGEGYSYVRVPNKPQTKEEAKEQQVKKTVTGTDADLRRLPLREARNLLRKFGVKDSEIKKLSRWEVIDVVRTMSTEQAKQGLDVHGWVKFARGNRYSAAEHLERYKEDCQRIFELQNRVLSSEEVLSTDEGSSSGEDSDFEEMGKNIESMLSNKKTSSQLSMEKEEQERRELRRMLMGDPSDKDGKDKKKGSGSQRDEPLNLEGRKLKITRTFLSENGQPYTRSEIVKNPAIIKSYVHIRQTKDPSLIKQFAAMDDQAKEEMRKERRRIQEQLRRIKRNQGKPTNTPPPKKPKKKKETAMLLKMKCGACGELGHMRTNKDCPMYNKGGVQGPVQVAMTEEQEEEEEKNLPHDEDLVNVEGIKLTVSKLVVERAENIRRKSMVLKFPKQAFETKKKRRIGSTIHCDYLKKPKQSSNRRRTDPVVTMSSMFEQILNEMRQLPNAQPFLFPVNPKEVPDYYKIIKRPMDLQTMRENVRNKLYKSREEFLNDVNQIVENSKLYNGGPHMFTLTAQNILELCLKKFAEKEQKFMRLEKAINPLLDDNDQVALSFIFEGIVNKMKAVENCWQFLNPVNKKLVKDYYDVIAKPMDLGSLLKNVQEHRYHTRDEFLGDVELVYTNSLQYNGAESTLTQTARKLMEVCKENLAENEETITQLEQDISAAQQAALDAAESDSMFTGTSLNRDDNSVLGADNESLDSFAMRDSMTIAEDENSGQGYGDQSMEMGSDSEFVDVEGFEQDMPRRSRKRRHSQVDVDEEEDVEDEEYGDVEEEEGQEQEQDDILGKLSESEGEDDHQPGRGFVQQPYMDESAFQGPGDEGPGNTGYMTTTSGAPMEDDEASFDPTDLFMNSVLATAANEQGSNIHDDLAVSDSDEEEEEGSGNPDLANLIPTENQHEEGFDIDEYL